MLLFCGWGSSLPKVNGIIRGGREMLNKKAQYNGGESRKAGNLIGTLVVIVFVAVVFICLAGFDVVDANHVGVKNRMGSLIGIQQEGMKWTGLFVGVQKYSKMTRPFTIEMIGDDSSATREGQSVFAIIKGNWRIKPSAVEEIYRNVGRDRQIYDVLNIEGRLKHGFKSVTTKYNDGLDIIKNRDEVMEKAVESMKKQFPNEYAELEFIVVENIWYDPAYQAAIDGKKAAEQLALKAEKEKAITQAEADKLVINAEGERDQRKARAEGEAYETRVKAIAEAEALRLKSQELTDLMVQNNWIDAWRAGGSQVPMWVTGEAGSNFLVQAPMGG